MKLEESELEVLLGSYDGGSCCEALLRDDFDEKSQQILAVLCEKLEKQLQVIALDAQHQSDVFWAANQAARKSGDDSSL